MTASNFGVRRRMSKGVSFSAWYSLSEAKSTTGNGSDELNIQNIQNHLDPFADVQFGPSGRTDARHRATISGVWNAPFGITVSPVWRFRSALPVGIREGIDLNGNGVNNEIATEAFAYDGLNSDGTVKLKDLGACTTINCGRGASQSTFNLRVSKSVHLRRHRPRRGDRRSVQPVQREEPERIPRRPLPGIELDSESGLPASDGVLRRLPEPGAARRPDRVPLRVLKGLGLRA